MPNRLAASTSAYLRQHAGNPVDWYPWGEEAFAAAKATDRPILLSVGYSACHWCHVMAHESFEDPAVAGRMNDRFVNVKVDREERPDVDALYMDAVQALTGQGGWPMTVFLTPDGEPFFGGTYFPPVPRAGLASFTQILDAVTAAWRERRGDVRRSATELAGLLREASAPPPDRGALSPDVVSQAARRIVAASDRVHGGLAGRMKFPSAPAWRFLLGHAVRRGEAEPMAVVVEALDAMAAGGLHDHIGGGFHRYCVDEGWTVPHFEKMLYDNAQLLRLYVAGWLATGTARYRRVAEETADYLLREMTGPHGAFYASQDADAPGGEGAYYVWTPDELRAVLPAPLADLALAWYGVHAAGNFHGGTVLSARRAVSEVSGELGLEPAVVTARLATIRGRLLAARGRRPQPATDRAVIAAWNGLTIDALARAAVALGQPECLTAALRAARFVGDQVTVAGGLAHRWADGTATVPAFLDDLAAMAGAYVTLYETTFDPGWLTSAQDLAAALRAGFVDVGGGFYRTAGHHDALVARQMDLLDASVPSGNALAAELFLRLAAITGQAEYEDVAVGALRRLRHHLVQAPGAMGAALTVLDDHLAGMRTVAVLGPRDRADTRALLAALHGAYWPGLVVAGADGPDSPAIRPVPMLTGRGLVDGRATAYVCRRGHCGLPATSPRGLAAQLREPPGA